MREITIQVNCPHCNGVKVKKNSKKATGKQNFLCHDCKKQFQYAYFYKDAELAKKELVKSMTLNGSGIRNISRVLGLSLGCILGVLRIWFKETNEPSFSGTYKEVQIDEMWTFVENRKQRKRWVWYAYDKETMKILAFQIGKRNDKSCKALRKKLSHLEVEKYCTDEWR